MRVIGIIAEFNPFHNGHGYLISKAREAVGDPRAIVLAVMSGSFVQRGTPAVLPKHIRARQALLNGADVVLELPFTFACAPSERFASGAVELLRKTGVVTDIAFGVDIDDPSLLDELAEISPDEEKLRGYLAAGDSFPSARAKAIIDAMRSSGRELSGEEEKRYLEALRMPNSILALDYMKAMKEKGARWNVIRVKREPSSSATETRRKLFDGRDKKDASVSGIASDLSGLMPDNALAAILSSFQAGKASFPDRDSWSEDTAQLVLRGGQTEDYAYMSDGLPGYLYNRLSSMRGFAYEDTQAALATKHFTMPRIDRALSSLLVGQTSSYVASEKSPRYIRVLGFTKDGRYCLKIMGKCAKLPVIHNLSDGLELCSSDPALKQQLELDIRATGTAARYHGLPYGYEWEIPPVTDLPKKRG